jgi:hypothetical protein
LRAAASTSKIAVQAVDAQGAGRILAEQIERTVRNAAYDRRKVCEPDAKHAGIGRIRRASHQPRETVIVMSRGPNPAVAAERHDNERASDQTDAGGSLADDGWAWAMTVGART